MKASQTWRSRFLLLLSLLLAPAVPALAAGAPGGKDLPPPPRVVASLYFKSDPGDYVGLGQEVTLTRRGVDKNADVSPGQPSPSRLTGDPLQPSAGRASSPVI